MPLANEKIPELTLRWANGDHHAAAFLENVAHAVRAADDIVDGDSSDSVKEMYNLLNRAFVFNANNPFFRDHADTLSAALTIGFTMWLKSEQWRHDTNRKTRMFAFIYREGMDHVAHVVAVLTGGPMHLANVMQDLHVHSHQSNTESFEDWESERV